MKLTNYARKETLLAQLAKYCGKTKIYIKVNIQTEACGRTKICVKFSSILILGVMKMYVSIYQTV